MSSVTKIYQFQLDIPLVDCYNNGVMMLRSKGRT